MAPRRTKVNKCDYKKLTANDVLCPVCRSILIKPITLPCTHEFCASCLDTTQNANLACPLCRVRVGSWLRSATKSQKVINESLWKAIQDHFPSQVKNKINGTDENFIDGCKMKEEKINTLVDASMKPKKPQKKTNVPSTSTSSLNTILKTHDQMVPLNVESKTQSSTVFLNKFANKEYTCRILCQDLDRKPGQESLTLIQKKNKRIQKLTESEDRSNSIESECLYFKPIDYRHNPPSKGQSPIKVPTRKPNTSPAFQILAPSGQNQININYLESAFARLFPAEEPPVSEAKAEAIDPEVPDREHLKRKPLKIENKSKRIKKAHSQNDEDCVITAPKNLRLAKPSEDAAKRALQEKADFELAQKLQAHYNQSYGYSTRSSAVRRTGGKKQVKIQGIMTPYKVK